MEIEELSSSREKYEAANIFNNMYSLQLGMTLRDYFAGQALIGILSGRYGEVEDKLSDDSYKDAVARISFTFADAMIEQRNKKVE